MIFKSILSTSTLVLLMACTAGPDGTPLIEQSLSVGRATNMVRGNANPNRVAWGLRQLNQAADNGDEDALRTLATFYEDGIGGVERDTMRALEYYERLMLINEDYRAKVVSLYLDRNLSTYDLSHGIALLEEGAARDPQNASARRRLINYYLNTNNTGIYDADRGLELATELADSEDPWAINRIGNLYFYGQIFEEDPVVAMDYYARAAALGNADAQFQYGIATLRGRYGIEKDEARGLEMIMGSAAEKQTPSAIFLARNFPDKYAQVTSQHLVDKGILPSPVQTVENPDLATGVFTWCREKGIEEACGLGLLEPDAIRALYLSLRRG